MHNLFVYGTLRYHKFQKEALHKKLNGSVTFLKEYKRVYITVKGEKYPLVLKSNKKRVRGLLLDISTSDLKKLDTYEHHYYRRKSIPWMGVKHVWVYMPDLKIVPLKRKVKV